MIAPYQVAPPQGNLLGSIQNFIGQRRQMQMLEQDRAREAATMAAINAQMGYGSGVDPFGMQKFETGQSNLKTAETNRQDTSGRLKIAQAAEGRAAQDYQSRNDYANNIMQFAGQNYAGNSDPAVQLALAGGSNPYAADAVLKALGAVSDREGKLSLQKSLQEVQNAGSLARVQAELQAKAKQAEFERAAVQQEDEANRQAISAAYAKGMATGDFGDLVGYAPNLLGSSNFPFMEETANNRITAAKQAEQDSQDAKRVADLMRGEDQPKRSAFVRNGETVDPTQQVQELAQAFLQRRAYRGKSPEQLAEMAVRETQSWGPDVLYPHVRALYPDQYNEAYKRIMNELLRQKFEEQKQAAEHPIITFFEKLLGGVGAVKG